MKTLLVTVLAILLALGPVCAWIPSAQIQASEANHAPDTKDDTVSTNEDIPLNGNVLADNGNGPDTDPDGDSLFVTASPIPKTTNGTLTIHSNGTFVYDPKEHFNGSDSFVYEVCDNGSPVMCSTATVDITIHAVNDTPTDITLSNNSIDEGQPPAITIGVFTTIDPDSDDDFVYSFADGPGDEDNGAFSLNADTLKAGKIYDYETKDTYSIRIRSTDNGDSHYEKAFTININDINDQPPVITTIDPTFTIAENSANGSVIGTILATDPEDNITGFSITSGDDTGIFFIDTGGNVTVADGNQLDYESTQQYSLTVQVEDPDYTDSTGVTIHVEDVNDPPVAYDCSASTLEDGEPIKGCVPDATDEDLEGFVVEEGYTADDSGLIGNLKFCNCGSYSYSPGANFQNLSQGEEFDDIFTYIATDNEGEFSNTATVTITITGTNDAPTGITLDNNKIFENEPAGTTVGSFDTVDIDFNDAHIYTLVSGTGSTSNHLFDIVENNLRTNTIFDYESGTPNYGIRVQTDDGYATYQKAFTITIKNANDPPVAYDDSGYEIDEGGTLIISPGSGVLKNDTNLEDEDLEAILVQTPNSGMVILNADGGFTYEHDGTETIEDSFTYQVKDEVDNLSNEATVTIQIQPVNDAPEASDCGYEVIRGNVLTVSPPGLLDHVTDEDNSPADFTAVLIGGTPSGADVFELNEDGSFIYEHNGDTSPTNVTFQYQVNDGMDESNTAVVTISITPPEAPVVINPTVSAVTQNSATISVEIEHNGGALIEEIGIAWSGTETNPSHTDACSHVGTVSAIQSGVYTVDISALEPGKTYYYKAYAVNSVGAGTTATQQFNTAPKLSNAQISPTSADEGTDTRFTFTGTIIAATDCTVEVDWGDGNSSDPESYSPGTLSLSLNHEYPEGPGSHQITLILSDSDEKTIDDEYSEAVIVNNVAPVVTIEGSPNPVEEGSTFTLEIGPPNDPGENDTVSIYTVEWDDSTSETFTSHGFKTHIYPDAADSISVRVSVEDDDHFPRFQDTISIQVTNVTPTANGDTYSTYENSKLRKYASEGLLSNETNPADEPLKVATIDQSATNGKVTDWNEAGGFTYDPNGAYDWLEEGETRVDTFAYTLEDDDGSTDMGIVNITIKGRTPSVSATQEQPTYTINISSNPTAAGSVTMTPAGGSYPEGTQVTLKALPASGFEFYGWGGDLISTARSETFNVDANMKITANFVAASLAELSTAGTSGMMLLSSGTENIGTPTQSGTESDDNGNGGLNVWVVMGPLLGVATVIAIARIERMGGFMNIRKSWNRSKSDLDV